MDPDRFGGLDAPIDREVTVLGAGTVDDIAQTAAQLKEKTDGLRRQSRSGNGGSRGIGRAIALRLASMGRHCALCATLRAQSVGREVKLGTALPCAQADVSH